MKKIIFIGAANKSHVLLVLGRLLTALDRRVLLVDSTAMQAVKDYLPRSMSYRGLQEFEGMDVMYGVLTPLQLKQELMREEQSADYDFLLLDTDHTQFAAWRDLPDYDKRVWCSNGRRLAMEKNESLMQQFRLQSEDGSLPFFRLLHPAMAGIVPEWEMESSRYPVRWEEEPFQFPLDERDLMAEWQNQHHSRIELGSMSGMYRHMLLLMLQKLGDIDAKTARRAWGHAKKRIRIR